ERYVLIAVALGAASQCRNAVGTDSGNVAADFGTILCRSEAITSARCAEGVTFDFDCVTYTVLYLAKGGDIDKACDGVRAIERALGSFQHFDRSNAAGLQILILRLNLGAGNVRDVNAIIDRLDIVARQPA